MTDIKVTDADRDAAIKIAGEVVLGNERRANIVAARHRIAAQRPLLEALIIALDSMESVDGENDCSRGIKAAEAAIKQAKGE